MKVGIHPRIGTCICSSIPANARFWAPANGKSTFQPLTRRSWPLLQMFDDYMDLLPKYSGATGKVKDAKALPQPNLRDPAPLCARFGEV